MSTTKHTPGPWHVGDHRPCIVYDAAGWAICNAVTFHGRGGDMSFNAALIAAAPDLLEACIDLMGLAEREGWIHEAINKARAAIAKATQEGKA